MIGQFAILILSIDALLRMLLDNDQTKEFIPEKLRKQNKYGAFSNGIWLVVILSGAIILIQTVMPGAASVLQQLTRLNSVCMPLRYLWVFVAYIALRKAIRTIDAEYRFVKSEKLPYLCLMASFITAACCIMGMYNKDPLTMALNIITPIVLTALGLILPMIAKREQRKES